MQIIEHATSHMEGSAIAVQRPDGSVFQFRQLRAAADHGRPVAESRWMLEVAVYAGTRLVWYPCAEFHGDALPLLSQISTEQRVAQAIVTRS